jgi:[acyl-carrier-protein] S-malonyltransferase
MKLAIVFAGQGAQYAGMGNDFYLTNDLAKQVYDHAETLTRLPLRHLCFQGGPELDQTINTQPAILTTSLAIYAVVKAHLRVLPDYYLGFSLGEYAALSASGVIAFDAIQELVKRRAVWMDEAAKKHPGQMAAVINADESRLSTLCDELSLSYGFLGIANYNSPTQHVVSGTAEAMNELVLRQAITGAKRIIKLNTSGAFHTPLMHEAAVQMRALITQYPHQSPHAPIIMNATALPLPLADLPALVEAQTEGPVRFTASIRYLINQGVDTFLEIGPGAVLSGLIRKIDANVKTIAIQTINDIPLLEELQ